MLKKAKQEASERIHFDALHARAREEENLLFYSKDLHNHPDKRIVVKGIEKLGSLNGKRILILGCGCAVEAWYMTDTGGIIHGMDIAFNPLVLARTASIHHGFSQNTDFIQMSVYSLGFKDNVFDGIYGHAILHHLELDRAIPEIKRILKPGGIAVFSEPFDNNPLLRFIRNHIPYPGKHRVPGEKALTYSEIELLKGFFTNVNVDGTEFIAMISRLWSHISHLALFDAFSSFLYLIDQFVFKMIPFTMSLSRSIIIILQ